MEWIRFMIGITLIIMGLLVFVIQLIGVYKFKYILNRMHAAAMGDTLGIGISLIDFWLLGVSITIFVFVFAFESMFLSLCMVL